jgi:SAM-dependent methyltransferase
MDPAMEGVSSNVIILRPAAIRGQVADAYAGPEEGREAFLAGLIGDADLDALITARNGAAAGPSRILDVGCGLGARTLQLALAFPESTLTGVDPRLEASDPSGAAAIARSAAHALGVTERVTFIGAGFAETETARLAVGADRRKTKVEGPEIAEARGPFDLAFIGGLSTAEVRAADIRLAASALAPNGLIASDRVIGPAGASVRAGVFDFLRYYPDFRFSHPPLMLEDRSIGLLSRKGDKALKGVWTAAPEEAPAQLRARLSEMAAQTFGGKPILEVTATSPMLGAAMRGRGLTNRTLRLTTAQWDTHFFEPVIDQITNALEHALGSVLFSADLMDFAPDEFLGRLFQRLADTRTPALFLATPPGEAGAAGPHSRPVARILDLAIGQGLTAYSPAGLEFERARHGWSASDAVTARPAASRHASLLLFAPAGGFRDARGRAAAEMTPTVASLREQVELQRVHSEALLRRAAALKSAEANQARAERERLSRDLAEAAEDAASYRERTQRSVAALELESARLREELGEAETARAAAAARAAEEMAAVIAAVRSEHGQRLADAQAAHEAQAGELKAEISLLMEQLAEMENARVGDRSAHDATLSKLAETEGLLASWDDRAGKASAALLAEAEAARERERLRGNDWRAEKDLHLKEIESLRAAERTMRSDLEGKRREADEARTRSGRLDGQLVERQREIDRLKAEAANAAAAAKTAAAVAAARIAELEKELAQTRSAMETGQAQLKAELSDRGLELVDAACRETDAQVRLDGVSAHLRMAQASLEAFRANPETFHRDELAYAPPPEGDARTDLLTLANELHGRAADLASEMARTFEDAASDWRVVDEMHALALETANTSHEHAMEAALAESARRIARLEAMLAAAAAHAAGVRRRAGGGEIAASVGADKGWSDKGGVLIAELSALESHLAHEAAVREADRLTAEAAALAVVETTEIEVVSEPMVELASVEPAPVEVGAVVEELVGEEAVDASDAELFEEAAPEPVAAPPAPPVAAVRVIPSPPPRPVVEYAGSRMTVRSAEIVRAPVQAPPVASPPVAETPVPEAAGTAAEADAAATAEALALAEVSGMRPAADEPLIRSLAGKTRSGARRLWNWARAYPETTEIVKLQRQLVRTLTPLGLTPKIFDAARYVSLAGLPEDMSPLTHYILHGEKAGLSPLPGFDPRFYKAGLPPGTEFQGTALRHFLTTGLALGYTPSEELYPLPQMAAGAGMRPMEFFFRWLAANGIGTDAGAGGEDPLADDD